MIKVILEINDTNHVFLKGNLEKTYMKNVALISEKGEFITSFDFNYTMLKLNATIDNIKSYLLVPKESKIKNDSITEDEKMLSEKFSTSKTNKQSDNKIAEFKIVDKIYKKLGLNILSDNRINDLKVVDDDFELDYYFTFNNIRYCVSYLYNLNEVEFSVIKKAAPKGKPPISQIDYTL